MFENIVFLIIALQQAVIDPALLEWILAVANFVLPIFLADNKLGLTRLIQALKDALSLEGRWARLLSAVVAGVVALAQTLLVDQVWDFGAFTPAAFTVIASAWWLLTQKYYADLKESQEAR